MAEKYRKPMEKMFYFFFAVIFIYDYVYSSMIIFPIVQGMISVLSFLPAELIRPVAELIFNIRHLIIIPAIFTILFEAKGAVRKLILSLLLFVGWFYAVYWRDSYDMAVFSSLLLIVAAAGRDIKKIGKIALLSGAGVICLAFILSRFGIIEDLSWSRPGSTFARHAFGMNYCTDLSAHVMFLILLYMFLKQGNLKWWEYLGIGILSVINILFVDGQISLFCVCAATAGCLVRALWRKNRWGLPGGIERIWKYGMVSSFGLLAALAFFFAIIYQSDPDIWYNRYYSLANRMYTNAILLKAFPFSWLGSEFQQVGYGGSDGSLDYYFWVDCSYTRLYAMYGAIAFVIYMSLLTGIQVRLMKRKAYFSMFLMAVVAVDCLIEHHMIEVSFNTFLLLAFAELGKVVPVKEETDVGEKGVGYR